MSIELFPGAALTPELHLQMEDLSDAKATIIVKMTNEGLVDVSFSRMSVADMAFMALKLQLHVNATVQGNEPDGTEIITPEAS